ncbi:MAG: hypothetical protein ACFFDN_28085 [Candidatus Hodarchaeota archaeon]
MDKIIKNLFEKVLGVKEAQIIQDLIEDEDDNLIIKKFLDVD